MGAIITHNTRSHRSKESEVPSKFKLVIGGEVYAMDGLKLNNLLKNSCLVEIKTELCLISFLYGKLVWRDQKGEHFGWNKVKRLEGRSLDHLISVANSAGGRRRVTVWWTSVVEFCRKSVVTIGLRNVKRRFGVQRFRLREAI